MSTQATRLKGLGRGLDETTADHPKYEAYKEARAAIEANDDVQELTMEFNQLRGEFNVSQQMGEVAQGGLRKIQTAQEELHSEPVVEEYLPTQAELVGELEGISEAASEPLTVDFGGEAGGCCNG